MVAALVRRARAGQRHARGDLGDAAHRGPVCHGSDRDRHAGRRRPGAARALSRASVVLRDGLCAAGDARSHHRALAAAAVRGGRGRSRLLDRRHRAHHADRLLRDRGGAVAAPELRCQPGGGRARSRLPAVEDLPHGDAAVDRAGAGGRLDACLHALPRRPRDRELHHRPRRDHAADPHLFGDPPRRETRDQRHLHDPGRSGRARHRGGIAADEISRCRARRPGAGADPEGIELTLAHVLVGKPASTFPGHALTRVARSLVGRRGFDRGGRARERGRCGRRRRLCWRARAAGQAFDRRADRLTRAAVLDRVQDRAGRTRALDAALRIGEHDRIFPRSLHHERQLELRRCGRARVR